jgi:S-formylglutathione hydrolase
MKIKQFLVVVVSFMFFCGVGATAQTKSGKLINSMIPAPSLAHSLFQTSAEQPAAVYLPPSYDDSTRRFPVVYFLPGFGCPIHYFTLWRVFQGFDLQQSLDSLIRSGITKEMIVVIPNGLNFMGGSFYTNSPVTGNWEDFIVNDVVGYVDSLYRTIRRSEARGITGYSMGGSGALSLAMKHPEIFGSVYALSPGVFAPGGLATTSMFADTVTVERYLDRQADFDRTPACDARARFMSYIDNMYKANQEMESFSYAYGAAFAPDTIAKVPFIAYPYHRIDGKLIIDSLAWKRFESGFGDWPNKLAIYKGNLLKLKAITIDYGTKDGNTFIPTGCVYLSALLDTVGVRHQLFSFEGGHGDRVRERIEGYMLPFFSKYLSAE